MIQLPPIPDRDADDVALVELPTDTGRVLVCAWSAATLARETVKLAFCRHDTWTQPIEPFGDAAFRPALAVVGSRALIAAIVPKGDRLVPVCWWLNAHGTLGQMLEAPNTHGHNALGLTLCAWKRRSALLAWECSDSSITIPMARVTGSHIESVVGFGASNAQRRAPALAHGHGKTWLAWVEEGAQAPFRHSARVLAAPINDIGQVGVAVPVDDHPASQDAPAIATCPSGAVVVWQTSAVTVDGRPGQDAFNWLRATTIDSQGATEPLAIPARPEHTRESAGEDQAWEFPAVAVPGANNDHKDHNTIQPIIAGRSAHGFHLVRAGDPARISCSDEQWGGRGRRGALCVGSHGVLYARAERDGVTFTNVQSLSDADMAPVTAPSTAAPDAEGVLFDALPTGKRGFMFGDLHQHSVLSDAVNTPEEVFARAKNRGYDFVALTDHESFCRRHIGPLTWRSVQHLVDRMHAPGEFVVLHAYEYTGARPPGAGHKCVYFPGTRPERLPDKNIDDLRDMLRRHDAFAVPHHLGFTGADIEHHDPEFQPVFEICSVHGVYEKADLETRFPPRADYLIPDQWAKRWLDEGHVFGLCGGTDSHGLLWQHGVCPKRSPWEAGLTGIVDADRSRDGVLGALKARRCFATTGTPIELRVTLDGQPMGSQMQGTSGSLQVQVRGTAQLQTVEVVSRGRDAPLHADGDVLDVTVPFALEPGEDWDYAYVRVTQVDGEMAWSSPVWLRS